MKQFIAIIAAAFAVTAFAQAPAAKKEEAKPAVVAPAKKEEAKPAAAPATSKPAAAPASAKVESKSEAKAPAKTEATKK